MKNLSLICGLTLLTSLAASGCRSDGFQTMAANTQATKSSDAPVSGTVPSGDDVVVPSGETTSGGTTTGGTTGGTTGDTTGDTTPPPVEDPFVSPTGSDCYRYLFVSTR